jgi:hypothetical protein
MNLKSFFFLVLTFFIFEKATASGLVDPVYDEDGKMFNYRQVLGAARIVFERQKEDVDLRMQAANLLVESSRWFHEFSTNPDMQMFRFELVSNMVFCDLAGARELARNEILTYMLTSKNYWSNCLRCLNRVSGLSITDKAAPARDAHEYLDLVEFLGVGKNLPKEPREHLLSSLNFLRRCITDASKRDEDCIDDLPFRTKFRLEVAKVLERTEELKGKISLQPVL